LTGKAGTGKTTFLKSIVENTHKRVVVAAPTGIAAINAGGVTLHSLFQLPFGAFVPENIPFDASIKFELNTPESIWKGFHMNKQKRALLREVELLIIDEVSMLRADLLDAIDTILRSIRRRQELPFGGLQVLFIGDLLQLPPVVKNNEWAVLSKYYESVFFFSAKVLHETPPIYVELDKIFRQSDAEFIELLGHFRDNKVTDDDVELLNKYYKPDFDALANDGYIQVTTHNRIADSYNKKALKRLDTKLYSFDAEVNGEFSEYMCPIDAQLGLKLGAQVMFIKNDYSGEHRYFNGKIGKVTELSNDRIKVEFDDGSDAADVEKYVWENKKYKLNPATNEVEQNVVGTFEHYPIKLAWAITVHKSQGLTFEKAVIDVAQAFAPGQIYVALSRLTSLDGLVLLSRVPRNMFKMHESINVFADNRQDINNLENELNRNMLSYVAEQVEKTFDFSGLFYAFWNHVQSYNKSKVHSKKQAYKTDAEQFLKVAQNLKDVADKFRIQIRRISENMNEESINLLANRLVAAKGYFEPQLKELSASLVLLINELSAIKGVKTYTNELRELERMLFSKFSMIEKSVSMVKSVLEHSEFTKDSLNKDVQFQRPVEAVVPQKRAPRKKGEKKPKVNTKKVSYDMYKSGKSLDDIAKERELTLGTIKTHMTHYVQAGQLDVLNFIDEDLLKKIIDASVEKNTVVAGDLKSYLGTEVLWSEIRMALAHLDCQKNA
jgi:cytidylate kinase